MASRYAYTQRSKDAPMDFQWTNRSNAKPVWAQSNDDPNTPKKHSEIHRQTGSHDESNPPATPLFNTPQRPTFGANQNVPFLFQPNVPPSTPVHPWAPPPNFSPQKAFPIQNDVPEVDMAEASPARPDTSETQEATKPSQDSERPVATGAMRRVYTQRTKSQKAIFAKSRQRSRRDDGDDAGSRSDSETDEDEHGQVTPMTQNTSNHYTLNMPAPTPPQTDTPYILLGYLQFFFNLTLILIFLYLVVQFILTVQRDVAHRISEHSQDIIQEISMCRAQYEINYCSEDRAPALKSSCANWATCMNRDPAVVGRAKVGAELIAEVVNGFVEPISWKTLIFTLTSLTSLTFLVNGLLSLYRSKLQPLAPSINNSAPSFPIAPATPYPHHYGGYLSPAAPNWGRYRSDEDMESPTRRRKLIGGEPAKIK